jgi:hypothetical protein
MQSTLTILNQYDIQTTPEAFLLAITKLAARVEAEGHSGVLGYRFFCAPNLMQARAVIDYADPAAWIGHHDISMNWPEMRAVHHAARLVEVTFLGEMTAEIQNWIDQSTLRARLNKGFDFVAGFHR